MATTTIRSANLPLRIRDLLAADTITGPSLNLESEPPPAIKEFIDKVIKSPLADIAVPLSSFRWQYNKGNFHHWRPLFLHFDTYFKSYISCRKDLLLSDDISEDVGSFSKTDVLQILRVMRIILENCPNKGSFGGLEHFKLLLASADSEVLIATLETLAALVKINPSKLPVSGKLINCGALNCCLLSLAQGWGSKEEGLGLYSCVIANEKVEQGGLSLFPSDIESENGTSQHRLGSTLYFEFHESADENNDTKRTSNLRVINIADLHLRKEDDISLLKLLVEQYHVPPECRFSLLTRIRYAHASRSRRTCSLYSKICLLSFFVLVQSNDAQDELVSFFANEPEYTHELIRIVRSEDLVPAAIKTLAMFALCAQLAAYSSSHDRARILSGSSLVYIGENLDILNVLQKEVSRLKDDTDPSSLYFLESLLQFYMLHVLSSSNSGTNVRGQQLVSALLPLLQDVCPTHLNHVCIAVKTLQKLMDYSNTAVTYFKEMAGADLLSRRLQTEVNRVIDLVGAIDSSMIVGELPRFDNDLLFSQKRFVKALLKALGSTTYAPANSTRSQNSLENSLPGSLSVIFQNVERFGGDIYSSAVTVMSEIIHRDPTSLPSLHELGLPEAFLASVSAGVFPSSKAMRCIPSGMNAICLNTKGLDAVKESGALRFLVEIFTTRKYVVAMNAGVVPLASGVDELLRHHISLRSPGVDIIVEIIEKLASLDDESCSGSFERGDGSVAMETESESKDKDGISNECFIELCIFHVMVLVHRTMESSDTSRIFVEKKGIEALMKLLLRPSIAQSTEGMSIAMHSTVVFKGFIQQHSLALAKAFSSSLREHLKKVVSNFASASGSFLLAPKTMPDKAVFSSLFVVEFLLFLAASKENRWVSALLTEFANESKDVLEDIGLVHREVLWQVALLDNCKPEKEDSNLESSSAVGLPRPETTTSNETEDQRLSPFRQFLDPLLRRRQPGWSVESQFLELINLYRDLDRAPGSQRFGTGGMSNPRLGGGHHHLQQSGLPDSTSPISKLENDDPRSYYMSCCDMMRSLSYHIRNLFLELGKAMLLPSRRRDDMNVSPSSKSVVSTIASIVSDHINFEGYTDLSRLEVSISTKCRYLGKVVDFVNGILLDKPDSCNPILVNCFYGHGVLQAVLNTFEATSQLLFTVNRVPASPMDTDDGNSKQNEEESDHSWIYGPLACYGTLMDHLVTSSFVFSPFTKHLLAQPLTNANVPFPRDPETFIKVLQSMVLKSVLPIWNHPHFTDCSYEFIAKLISIIRHVYSGVEIKNVNGTVPARVPAPPPNESTISMIVDMGFPRLRVEEALRQVGRNSVEMAMEWLCSHPEEAPAEDDELARALAMSLGNESGASTTEDITASGSINEQEEDILILPPVDELLSTCMRLLPLKEPLAFPIRDLLVMICSQNNGEGRPKVISFIIDHLKISTPIVDSGKNTVLSSLFHVIALVLHEDTVAREVASQNGLIAITSDLLSQWELGSNNGENLEVPKWVTAAFLALDRLLQVDSKLNAEIIEKLKQNSDLSSNTQENSIIINEEKANEVSTLPVDGDEQKRIVEISCRCIRNHIPSETMHVVLQLCATLTRTHSGAVNFLEAGGLTSLLSLPTKSLFSGFDNVASMIIRHILEDPQTLQQAMESEIRHTIVAATSRHANGRVTPRSFITALASVISRDPVVFMQAAQSVCQVEMVGERPYVVLVKDREKDKKDKVQEKDKAQEKDKQQTADGKPPPGDATIKNVKVHRKPPPSFTTVIELLLDSVITFVPSSKDEVLLDEARGTSSFSDMEIDDPANKGKGKAIASVSVEGEVVNDSENPASLAKTVFLLKLLNDIILTYSSSVHVLLRRDTEIASFRGFPQKSPNANSSGGIFHHVLHKFLAYSGSCKKEKKGDGDWRQKLAYRASQFLVAACVRSTEARKRNFIDINNVFNDFVDLSDGFRSANCTIHAFVDLLNEIFVARSPTGSLNSAEASAAFIDIGLVSSLTHILQVLDLDHVESPKVVTGIVKVLELVTKEHVLLSDKGENLAKSRDSNLPRHDTNAASRFPSLEITFQPDLNEITSDPNEPFNPSPNSGSSESITDDMEHDRDLERSFAPETEDDFMREASEEPTGLEDGIETVGIRFEIQHNGPDDNGGEDDDEEMSEDDGDEVDDDDDDDDDEEHHDLVEDDVRHHMHPDTDQEDHDIDEDEFDEDVLEEEDEDDEDDEDGVILRLEEGINGINVFDQIEVFGRESNFPNETLHVMPIDVDVFGGSRRRTTSIYNILGRTSDHAAPLLHPLLSEASSPYRQLGDSIFSGRGSELDSIFRSLRNGRQHRLNMWSDDTQLRGGSSGTTIPQGLEELLVSQLRRPTTDNLNETNTGMREPEAKEGVNQLEEARGGVESLVENNVSMPDSELVPETVTSVAGPEVNNFLERMEISNSQTQAVDSDIAVRDIEAISQESGGSGATLGESLLSLEVEIGSADGHDDGDRQGSTDRLPGGNPSRSRRLNINTVTTTNRDPSLQSVNEVSENPTPGGNEGAPSEEQQNNPSDSGSIDQAFLDALPEELRAEVLSAQHGQASEPANSQPQSVDDIDPEFLAALPSDIRAEVLAQQQAQILLQHQSQELEGQPVEMDTVSIIATFPSELREEVLLTSSDAILANLTPALVAEANMLRERFAHRYHSRTLFGMYPRSQRGVSTRRGDGSSLDRVSGGRSIGGKLVEAEGSPLVNVEALKSMIRLLRVVQPIYKGQFLKLLLNLSAHRETRASLVQILMEMLMLDTRKSTSNLSGDGEPSYRLYACQNNVMYSRPQFSDGVPPLVSRRILETLSYLARNHPNVAKLFLQLEMPNLHDEVSLVSDKSRGKEVMITEDEIGKRESQKGDFFIFLLLTLLKQPLYLRSIAHLEQLLNLLDVIINNCASSTFSKPEVSLAEDPSGTPTAVSDAALIPDVGVSSMGDVESGKTEEVVKPITPIAEKECDQTVLLSLPQTELRLLCSLLAQEGLSSTAYSLVGDVLRKLVSIAPTHCNLFISELADSVRNLTKSGMSELHIYGEGENALLSSTTTDGTAILRVLQALCSLVASLNKTESASQEDGVPSRISEVNAALEPLWFELSSCISKIESFSDSAPASSHRSSASSSTASTLMPSLPAGTQNILPYIESFFVTCEKLHLGQPNTSQDVTVAGGSDVEDVQMKTSTSTSTSSSSAKVDDKHVALVKFSDKHRKLLNAFIRQNPGLLEKSFSLMLKVPRVIDFDNKRSYFRSKIKHLHDHHHSPLKISVRRAYILEDSYNQMRMRSAQDLKGRLTVHFQGEEGIDAGGLTREWYQLLSRVIFDKGALLFTTVGNDATFQPNPNSVYQTEHLSYFKFVGRVVGKALFDGQLLDVHFTRSFYKHILGVKVTYHDIEAIDPDYFKNLKWMLENDITDVLDLTFSMDADEEKLILYERAEVTDYELIPGGRNIRVTEENKHEYVDLVAEHRLTTAIRPQINAFLEGFNELISRDLVSIFNDKELELLISGLPDIDLEDMRANTEYSGYSAGSPVIQWFWEVVQGLSKEDKARLLQFVTGTSKVPLEGFSALQGISGSQRFQIHKAYGSPDHLPSAHTCFNQLDVPEYPSKEHLEERLLLAIHEANEGFGFG